MSGATISRQGCAHCGTAFIEGQEIAGTELELEYGAVALEVCLRCLAVLEADLAVYGRLCAAVRRAAMLTVDLETVEEGGHA